MIKMSKNEIDELTALLVIADEEDMYNTIDNLRILLRRALFGETERLIDEMKDFVDADVVGNVKSYKKIFKDRNPHYNWQDFK